MRCGKPCRRCCCQRVRSRAYALFQLRDAPDTFYMRESWRNQEALDAHVALPHFQNFIAQMNNLLAEPLRLDYLTPVAP